MKTPGNVPRPPRGREFWERDPATYDQMRSLRWHFAMLALDPVPYFGDGFAGINALNKWAAAWAIDDLKRVMVERDAAALQCDVDAVNADIEPRMKSMIANIFRGGGSRV